VGDAIETVGQRCAFGGNGFQENGISVTETRGVASMWVLINVRSDVVATNFVVLFIEIGNCESHLSQLSCPSCDASPGAS